ncbi:ceramidase-domain-containing protein [Rhizoctonia solani]|nr:ceramidase-domain-containing protein [Rhizoctonia solani]
MTEPVHRIGQKTSGAWGLHTATIDWCEDNYTHSHYVAEWYNTISNIPFILLGLFSAYSCLAPHLQPNRKPLPDAKRHAAGNIGIMCIGFGSAIFHATLKWHAQVLLDELPMIFVTSLVLYRVCADEERWRGENAWKLKVGLAAVPLSVSAIYLYYPNPVLHQVCFGILLFACTHRTFYLFKTAPPTVPASDLRAARHYIFTGSLLFILAFGIWNVDNGHAWWHLLTGLGCTRIGVGTSCDWLIWTRFVGVSKVPWCVRVDVACAWVGSCYQVENNSSYQEGKGRWWINGSVKMDKWQ